MQTTVNCCMRGLSLAHSNEALKRCCEPRATPVLLSRELLPVNCTESYSRSAAPRATPGGVSPWVELLRGATRRLLSIQHIRLNRLLWRGPSEKWTSLLSVLTDQRSLRESWRFVPQFDPFGLKLGHLFSCHSKLTVVAGTSSAVLGPR